MKDGIRLDFIRTFIEVLNKGSLLGAAKSLGLSVSTVSFHVSSVEKFYGAKLIEKRSDRVVLTEEGKIAYKNMLEIMDSIAATKKKIENLKKLTYKLAIGVVCIPIIGEIQNAFRVKYPDANFEIIMEGANICLEMLKKGEVDGIFVGYLPEDVFNDPRFKVYTLGVDEILLITPPDAKELHKKEPLYIKDLLEYTLISLTWDFGITSFVEKTLRKAGYSLDDFKSKIFVNSIYSQIYNVSQGLGIALTSFIACKRACELGIIKIRKVADFNGLRKVYFATLSNFAETDKMKKFTDFLVNYKSKIFNEYNPKNCRNKIIC